MTTKSCNQSTTSPKKLSLRSRSALGVAARIVLFSSFLGMSFIDVLVLLGNNPAFANTSVEEGFESGSIAGYGTATEGSGSFQIISGDAREGNNSLRITKDKGARRYELRLTEYSKPTELWYGFSMRLQPNMQSPDDFLIISQWHNFPDSGEDWHKPDAFIRLNSDFKTGFSNYWDSRSITPSSDEGGEGKKSDLELLTMAPGQWFDFVIHYKYSSSGDGLIEIYGAPAGSKLQLLQQLVGPNSFNDERGQFRIGLYADENLAGYIDYDAFRSGSSFDDVVPQ